MFRRFTINDWVWIVLRFLKSLDVFLIDVVDDLSKLNRARALVERNYFGDRFIDAENRNSQDFGAFARSLLIL